MYTVLSNLGEHVREIECEIYMFAFIPSGLSQLSSKRRLYLCQGELNFVLVL